MDELTFLVDIVLPANMLHTDMVFHVAEVLNVCLDGIWPIHKSAQESGNGKFSR